MFVFEVIFHFITMAIFGRGMIIDTELVGEFLLNFSKSKIGVYFFKIGPKNNGIEFYYCRREISSIQ